MGSVPVLRLGFVSELLIRRELNSIYVEKNG
jgi:hypothetical protein